MDTEKSSASLRANPEKSEERIKAETIARCLLGHCASCGISGFDVELFPAEDLLAWFEGDELCEGCL